jgi:hypothetical protein
MLIAYLSPLDLAFLLRWKADHLGAPNNGKTPAAVSEPHPVAHRRSGRLVMLG